MSEMPSTGNGTAAKAVDAAKSGPVGKPRPSTGLPGAADRGRTTNLADYDSAMSGERAERLS